MTPPSMSGLYERLDEIKELLSEMKADNARFDQRIIELEKKAQEHRQAIKGNGKIGLEERTSLMEAQLTQIRWIGGAIVLMVIGDIVARILAAI